MMVLERVWGPIGRSADGVLINQPQQGILIVTNVRDPELSMGILYDQSHFGNREKHEIPELFHVHVGASLQSVPPTRDSKGHTEALRLHRSPESPAKLFPWPANALRASNPNAKGLQHHQPFCFYW